MKQVKAETKSVINYEPGQILKNEELFTLPLEVLVPASIPEVINEKNVDKIQARIVVEAANIPVKPEIEKILYERGILIVPDFVANAGGVISSHAEYLGENPRKMFEIVEEKIVKNSRLVLREAAKAKIPPRGAALEIAKTRVKEAMKKKRNSH